MPAIVNSVISGSIAEELEIQKGDELLSIDGINICLDCAEKISKKMK